MTIRKRASAAKDATDLSAEYRGLYGFAHIGVAYAYAVLKKELQK